VLASDLTELTLAGFTVSGARLALGARSITQRER
jgi:hypothetical protein